MANAAFLAARLGHREGQLDQALDLLERLIESYGQPGVADHRRTAAVAGCEVAWMLGQAGRLDDGIHRYSSVIKALGDTGDGELRRLLAKALAGKAFLLSESGVTDDRDALARELIERFGGTTDADIADNVAWARMVLDEHSSGPRRRRIGRRR